MINEILRNRLGDEWYTVLQTYVEGKEFAELGTFLAKERETKTIYPAPENYFRAFKETPFSKVKVVILGQDCYPNGQADGLAFSATDTEQFPPSLKAIFEEVERDMYDNFKVQQDWDLTRWAEQGVLLLNTILTVVKGKPKSHAWIGWEKFTRYVIEAASYDVTNRKVFMLWGQDAKSYKPYINSGHLILEAGHPATKYYGNDTFSSCGHFSKANEFLKQINKKEIIW